jgi:hypothetical protein
MRWNLTDIVRVDDRSVLGKKMQELFFCFFRGDALRPHVELAIVLFRFLNFTEQFE